MPVDKFGRMSDTKTRDTGVSLTYINNNHIRSDRISPVSGSIDMRGNTLYNVSNPVNLQDVATKEYTDQVGGGSPFLKEKSNYKATHTINMVYNKLLNLHNPTEPYDAATKDYVDYVKTILDERLNTVDKRPHIISVNTHYYGPLIKEKYQFTFGENKENPVSSGFLIPHSGRIKKIASRVEVEHTPIKSDDENVIVMSSGLCSDLTGSMFSFHLNRQEEYYLDRFNRKLNTTETKK